MMKETAKKFAETKTITTYSLNRSKPLSFTTKFDNKDPSNGCETKSLSIGQASPVNPYSDRPNSNLTSNQSRAYIWSLALKAEKSFPRLINDDIEIERITLDLPNQRVVRNDCMRTRVGILDDSMRDLLEKVLTAYCKFENITYKQGLNEVAAPFICFRKSQISISEIYNDLALFIDKFLPTSFIDEDFLSLQCYFRTLELLLKYHDPNFHTFLTIHDLPSELYATPWFLTLFASKMSLDMVYLLWDIYIYENDTCFKFFISLALLLENKNTIIGSETSMIPQAISNLTVSTPDQMKQIYKRAIELRLQTPSSFLGKLRELDIFKKDYLSSHDLKIRMEKNVEYLESLQCVLVSPHEIINALYRSEITCSNHECVNCKMPEFSETSSRENRTRAASLDVYKRDRKTKKSENSKDSPYFDTGPGHRNNRKSRDFNKGPCILCQSVNSNSPEEIARMFGSMPHLREFISFRQAQRADTENEPPMDFIIVDLRQNRSAGLLPKSNQVEFKRALEETINYLINDFIELQSQYHFVFMTSNFNSWAFKEVWEIQNQKSKRGPRGSIKAEKPLTKGNMSVEDEWLVAFLDAFIQNGFPYLSILEGGFNEINKILHVLNLETVSHNAEHCSVCRAETGSKGPSFFNFVNKVIDKTGEKLGMLVEGINSNSHYSDASRYRSRNSTLDKNDTSLSRTSHGLSNLKKDEELKPPLANRERDKPRSLTSVPTPSNVVTQSVQETGEYFPALSIYNSEPSTRPSLVSVSSAMNRYLQGGSNTIEDPPASKVNKTPNGGFMDIDNSGRITAPGKILTSTPTYTVEPNPSKAPKFIQGSNHSSFSKSSSTLYGTQSIFEPPKSIFGPQTSLAETFPSPKGGESIYNKLSNNQASSISQNKDDILNASRYVFDGQKKKTEELEGKKETNEELKLRKQSSSQDKKNPSYHPYKAKSNDKLGNYNNFAVPALAKILRPPSQDEQKPKFYSTENSVIKTYERDNKVMKDKNEQFYKENSSIDTFHQGDRSTDKINPDMGYNSLTPKGLLQSYTRQMISDENSNSKKGTVTQIFKGGASALAQTLNSRADSEPNNYQYYNKPVTAKYNTANSNEIPTKYTEDLGRKASIKLENNPYLENLGGDLLSTREINSPQTISQSPSPQKGAVAKKMLEKEQGKSKDITIDTTLVYSNCNDYTSPIQADVLKNAVNQKAQPTLDSSYYEKNGIFKELRLSQNGMFWLYKTFEGVQFSYYCCDYVKNGVIEDPHYKGPDYKLDPSNRRIIIVSKDFLVGLQYSPEIVEDLKFLQFGVSVERILKRDDKMYVKDRNSFDGTGLKKYEVIVKSIFPVKLLLRITSKKIDAKLLSFYFKLPTIDRMTSTNTYKFFNFTEQTIQELPYLMKRDEYIKMLREVSDIKEQSLIVQSKSVYCFGSSGEAQECIQKTKDAYSHSTSYINERMKRNNIKN